DTPARSGIPARPIPHGTPIARGASHRHSPVKSYGYPAAEPTHWPTLAPALDRHRAPIRGPRSDMGPTPPIPVAHGPRPDGPSILPACLPLPGPLTRPAAGMRNRGSGPTGLGREAKWEVRTGPGRRNAIGAPLGWYLDPA